MAAAMSGVKVHLPPDPVASSSRAYLPERLDEPRMSGTASSSTSMSYGQSEGNTGFENVETAEEREAA